MLKKRYIKKMYIEEAVCDRCGSLLEPTGTVLMSWPEQYPYQCPQCGWTEYYHGGERPGTIKYELEDEDV